MSQGSVLQGKNFLSSPTQLSAFMPWHQKCHYHLMIAKISIIIILMYHHNTCGLGLVQERTLVSTPPPQEALQGVETVDQGLKRFKFNHQGFKKV